jgi:hypothetical protein
MKQFFTPRRQGAKGRIESNYPSFVGYAVGDAVNALLDQVLADEAKNLSALASLREISALQSHEGSFTLRREGAKRSDNSKDWRFFGHTIGDALNAMLDQVFAEIDKEAESLIHQPQIGQDLFAVDRIERCNRFDFHNYAIVDDQVSAEAFVEPDSIPCDRNNYLPFHGVAVFAQFMRKQDFVYDFEDAGPEPGVQAVGRVNDHSRDFILFHTAKLVLLLLICEAKNPSAAASPRETSATQSKKTLFRKGTKAPRGQTPQVARFQFQTLASLRDISGSKYKRKVRTT